MKSFILGIPVLLSMLYGIETQANELGRSYQFFNKGLWQFDWTTSRFTSEDNYDASGGAIEALPDANNIATFDSKLSLTYGLSRNWNIWGQGAVGYIESVDLKNTRTNSAPTYVDLGTEFRLFKNSYIQIIPAGRLRIPLYRVEPNTDEALPTEGSMEAEGLMLLQNRIGPVRSHAYLGFRYRDEQRSSQIPWGLGSEFWLGSWAFEGTVSGNQTADRDQYSANPGERHKLIEEVNAGSFRYYSVNPEILKVGLSVRYALDRHLLVRGGLDTSLNGKNNAAGTELFVRLSWLIWPSKELPGPKPQNYENFRIDTDDGVDHRRLFESPQEDQKEHKKKREKEVIDKSLNQIEKALDGNE